MTEVIWAHRARRDLFDIAEQYRKVDPTLPYEILMRIERAPLSLLEFPKLGGPTAKHGIRKWPVRGTPFLLFYAAIGNRIEIRRVRHVASNWREDWRVEP